MCEWSLLGACVFVSRGGGGAWDHWALCCVRAQREGTSSECPCPPGATSTRRDSRSPGPVAVSSSASEVFPAGLSGCAGRVRVAQTLCRLAGLRLAGPPWGSVCPLASLSGRVGWMVRCLARSALSLELRLRPPSVSKARLGPSLPFGAGGFHRVSLALCLSGDQLIAFVLMLLGSISDPRSQAGGSR